MEFLKSKEILDIIVDEYHAPGVDCMVYKEHTPIFRYYRGMKDLENCIQMTGNEIYIIFSMTKMITCTAALQLYEKGKFLLNEPVSKYMPEFEKMQVAANELNVENAAKIASGGQVGEEISNAKKGYAQNRITIRDLFTMQAGLDYNLNAQYIKDAIAKGKTSTRDLVGTLSDTVLGFEPGTRYRYSLCHDVLGALIEVWSGKRLSEYLKEHIFAPLEMKDTFFGVPTDKENLSRMMLRYVYDENRKPKKLPLECPYNLSEDYESGGAGLCSTTEDYGKFLDALACGGKGKTGDKILSSAMIDLMRTNHLVEQSKLDFNLMRPGYGYGLGMRTHIDKAQSGSLSPIGEFGWDGAAGAFSMVDIENKISLVYFQEIHNADFSIHSKIRNALYADLF